MTDYIELINRVREEAEWGEANEWETPIMLSDHAIEELTAFVHYVAKGGQAVREKTCYNCFWGGDGEEVNDFGKCWCFNGEAEFEQPPKECGCDSWSPKEE